MRRQRSSPGNVVLFVIAALFSASGVGPLASDENADLEIDGGLTLIGQHADDERVKISSNASLDLYISATHRPGTLKVYVEGNTTPGRRSAASLFPAVNADEGSALNGELHGRLQVSELKYDFRLRGQSVLTVGLLDPSAYLDTTRIDNDENLQFLASPFVNNPAVELPDYTPGVVIQMPAISGRVEVHAALTASNGLADNPDRSYSELFDVGRDDKGVFGAVETGWHSEKRLYRVGVWVRSNSHETLDGSSQDRSNQGLWAAGSQKIGRSSLNLRFGVSDPDVSEGDRFASLSYQLDADRWILGLGLASVLASRKLAAGEDQLHAEAYLSVRVAKDLYVTPSLQGLWNSAFDSSGEANRTAVFSLRIHKAFVIR